MSEITYVVSQHLTPFVLLYFARRKKGYSP